ncbi:MAG: hypothetical protein KAQ97_04790 [Candidatus Fermentibacteraceae bacterium]|nr:hypothetical protein [Candidatus Fermentibacteraceae bacterium]
MTDSAYSLLLFAGLVAGPASAFIVNIEILPVFLIFPLLCLAGKTGKGSIRLLFLITAPVLSMIYGLLSDNPLLADRSLRWTAAVATGVFMSGSLGSSRASRLLHSASNRVKSGGMLETLAMVISLAGPFSNKIRTVFSTSRKNGISVSESFTIALSSVYEIEPVQNVSVEEPRPFPVIAACCAWLLLLAGISGVL